MPTSSVRRRVRLLLSVARAETGRWRRKCGMNGPTTSTGTRTGRETLSPARTAGDSFRRVLTTCCLSAWLSPGFHRFCRRRWIRNVHALPAREARLAADPRSAVAVSPALPSRTGVSRASTGVPSYSRTPLTRGPVVGLFLSPPRRRHTGPVRSSFETWASTHSRVYRRRPPPRPSRLSPIRNGTSVCVRARSG